MPAGYKLGLCPSHRNPVVKKRPCRLVILLTRILGDNILHPLLKMLQHLLYFCFRAYYSQPIFQCFAVNTLLHENLAEAFSVSDIDWPVGSNTPCRREAVDREFSRCKSIWFRLLTYGHPIFDLWDFRLLSRC